MNSKKTNPHIVQINVKENHLYEENSQEHPGVVPKKMITVNMKTKSINFSALYKRKRSYKIAFKMEQIGQVQLYSDGKFVIMLEPLQIQGHTVITLYLEKPKDFHQKVYKGFRDIVLRTKSDASFRNEFQNLKVIDQSDNEESELQEAQELIKQNLDEPKKESPLKKKSPAPMRRSLRLQQQPSTYQKKSKKQMKSKVTEDIQNQPFIDRYMKRKEEEESKEEVKVKLEERPSQDKTPKYQELDTQLRKIVKNINPQMQQNSAIFSFETTKFLVLGEDVELLKSLSENAKLLQKYHWILPFEIQGEIVLCLISHPYNIYNHAIAERAANYNKNLVQTIVKRDPLESEIEINNDTEKAKIIIIGSVPFQTQTTIKLAVQKLLTLRFFIEYLMVPGQTNHVEGQLTPIKIGPFSFKEAKIQEGKSMPNLYKFFFLNYTLWKPSDLEQYYSLISIETQKNQDSKLWEQNLGALAIYADNFRFLQCYGKRQAELELSKQVFYEVKREAQENDLTRLPLEEIGRMALDKIEILENGNKGMRGFIKEMVHEKNGEIKEESDKLERQYDERGLRSLDDIKEEQKSVVGRG